MLVLCGCAGPHSRNAQCAVCSVHPIGLGAGAPGPHGPLWAGRAAAAAARREGEGEARAPRTEHARSHTTSQHTDTEHKRPRGSKKQEPPHTGCNRHRTQAHAAERSTTLSVLSLCSLSSELCSVLCSLCPCVDSRALSLSFLRDNPGAGVSRRAARVEFYCLHRPTFFERLFCCGRPLHPCWCCSARSGLFFHIELPEPAD